MNDSFTYKIKQPDKSVSDFVESFWYLKNHSDNDKETIGLPDGRIDLFLFKSAKETFRMVLIGLGTEQHEKSMIPANSTMFSISFKPLAVEYVFHEPIAAILNSGKVLPEDFWDFNEDDLNDFEVFCEKASQKIELLVTTIIDTRKQKLFDLIYDSKGSISVAELSDNVGWSSRQMNRYFNQQFGLSLSAFCKILRFRAALDHIAKGKLFPEMNFVDQTHFIKEIKKFSGVAPKELFKNKNDRFILLSTLASE